MMAKSECVVTIGEQLTQWDILIILDMKMVKKTMNKLKKADLKNKGFELMKLEMPKK